MADPTFSQVSSCLLWVGNSPLCNNDSTVGLQISSSFVRAHDAISIIAIVSPSSCIINKPMQPVFDGIAIFPQAIFSGYIGQCSIIFEAYFHDSPNTKAANSHSATTEIRVIASNMELIKQLNTGPLVAGFTYDFSGIDVK